jgi:uncharacterized phage-associated protein
MSRATIEREKLLNAIIFFTKNTRHCYKLKLFKLLYLLDFQIYRETGRSTTGLAYFAWPKGPVPRALYNELDAPRDDMREVIALKQSTESDPDFTDRRLIILARRQFDDGCFTPRELVAMQVLADIYLDAIADQMTEVTHLKGRPWHQVYEVEMRHQAQIPYALALDDKPGSLTKEQADTITEEEREVAALFK